MPNLSRVRRIGSLYVVTDSRNVGHVIVVNRHHR